MGASLSTARSTPHFERERLVAEELGAEIGRFVADGRQAALAASGAVDTKSSPSDLVTVMDREAERRIRERIAVAFPEDRILGEEFGGAEWLASVPGRYPSVIEDVRLWIIDPIDGTANYVRGLPLWSVSIALWDGSGPALGVVAIPRVSETYVAVRGDGASCNGERLAVRRPADAAAMIVATGFSYSVDRRRQQWDRLGDVAPSFADIRRSGSAAVDLAHTAAGMVDAYVEGPINPWDFAAGALLVTEAGGEMRLSPMEGLSQYVAAGSAEALRVLDRLGLAG